MHSHPVVRACHVQPSLGPCLHLRQMVASNERPHGCGGVRTELPQHELQSMVGHFYTMHTYSHIFIFSMFLVYATLCTDVKRISILLLLYSLLPFLSFLPRFRRSGMRAFVIGMQTTRPTRTSSTYVLILSAMCKWSDLYQLAEDWGAVDDETRQKMSIVASAAAWGLGEWNRMKEYAGSIPKGTMDCSFYHALLNMHDKKFDKAQEVCVASLSPSILPLSFHPPSLLPSSLSSSLLSSIHTSLYLPPIPLPPSQCISDARDILLLLVRTTCNRTYSVMVSTQPQSELE